MSKTGAVSHWTQLVALEPNGPTEGGSKNGRKNFLVTKLELWRGGCPPNSPGAFVHDVGIPLGL
jgi:hypothetical protein